MNFVVLQCDPSTTDGRALLEFQFGETPTIAPDSIQLMAYRLTRSIRASVRSARSVMLPNGSSVVR